MKRVYKADMVAHVWAQASQDTGYTSSRNFSFEGSVLFSYATPIANFTTGADGERVYLISSHKYSNTTNRHQSAARSAVRYQRAFCVPDVGASGGRVRSAIGWPMSDAKSWAPVHAANMAHIASTYAENVAKCLRFQSWYWADMGDVLTGLETYQQRLTDYALAFGLECPTLPCAGDAARIWERCERLNAKRSDPAYSAKAEWAREVRKAAKALDQTECRDAVFLQRSKYDALLEQYERMRGALECQAARKLDTHQFYEVLMRHGWDLGRNSNTTPEEFVAQLTDAAIKPARGES